MSADGAPLAGAAGYIGRWTGSWELGIRWQVALLLVYLFNAIGQSSAPVAGALNVPPEAVDGPQPPALILQSLLLTFRSRLGPCGLLSLSIIPLSLCDSSDVATHMHAAGDAHTQTPTGRT